MSPGTSRTSTSPSPAPPSPPSRSPSPSYTHRITTRIWSCSTKSEQSLREIDGEWRRPQSDESAGEDGEHREAALQAGADGEALRRRPDAPPEPPELPLRQRLQRGGRAVVTAGRGVGAMELLRRRRGGGHEQSSPEMGSARWRGGRRNAPCPVGASAACIVMGEWKRSLEFNQSCLLLWDSEVWSESSKKVWTGRLNVSAMP